MAAKPKTKKALRRKPAPEIHLYKVSVAVSFGAVYYVAAESFADAEKKALARADREYTTRADVKAIELIAIEITR